MFRDMISAAIALDALALLEPARGNAPTQRARCSDRPAMALAEQCRTLLRARIMLPLSPPLPVTRPCRFVSCQIFGEFRVDSSSTGGSRLRRILRQFDRKQSRPLFFRCGERQGAAFPGRLKATVSSGDFLSRAGRQLFVFIACSSARGMHLCRIPGCPLAAITSTRLIRRLVASTT
jgi:hypothetical protein